MGESSEVVYTYTDIAGIWINTAKIIAEKQGQPLDISVPNADSNLHDVLSSINKNLSSSDNSYLVTTYLENSRHLINREIFYTDPEARRWLLRQLLMGLKSGR